MKKLSAIILIANLICFTALSRPKIIDHQSDHKALYQKAFDEHLSMLQGEDSASFTKAVFIAENAYYGGKLKFADFQEQVKTIADTLTQFMIDSDVEMFETGPHWAINIFLTEPDYINNWKAYRYDFRDYFGEKDWTKMFVTKLLRTKKGNCHSFPFLFKILSEQMNVKSYLALTPNHIYIKHIGENGGWVNIELTNGTFPKDSWIKKEFKWDEQAIANKIYMHPLTDKESVAFTLFDLSVGYEKQFGKDSLFLAMTDSALKYFPQCIPLLMNKANYFTYRIEEELNKSNTDDQKLQQLYVSRQEVEDKMIALGHREMSKREYRKWLERVQKEKEREERRERRITKRENKRIEKEKVKAQKEYEKSLQDQ